MPNPAWPKGWKGAIHGDLLRAHKQLYGHDDNDDDVGVTCGRWD